MNHRLRVTNMYRVEGSDLSNVIEIAALSIHPDPTIITSPTENNAGPVDVVSVPDE